MLNILILSVLLGGNALVGTPGEIVRSFPSPSSCPSGLAFDGQNLWLAEFKTDSLYAISPSDGKVARSLPAPSYRPYGLAWDGSYLWLVDGEENNILQFDTQSGITIKAIPSPLQAPSGLAWDGKDLWLADLSTINKVSSEDGTIIKSFPAPSGQTTGLTFDGTYLWSADRGRNRIHMILPETGPVIMILDSPGQYPWGLAFADGKMFNVDYQTDLVYEIVAEDSVFFSQSNRQSETMNYSEEVRNYGPGTLKSLDLYLAIPENSGHQVLKSEPVYFASVMPRYVRDKWNQPFAAFHFENVEAGWVVKVSYSVTADLYETRYFIRPEKVKSLRNYPDEMMGRYLADDTKFDLKNPIVQNAVKQAVGDEVNSYWKARKIYRWCIDHLSYELSGGWNVAPAVIERGTGSCSEYSFVFIAMCRAAGIPARYTGAITIRGDQASEDNVFHRWCEVYLLPYGWVPVDPSGGDTPSAEGQAMRFGFVGNSYLVTTTGAGSDLIGWQYNSGERWQSEGKCKIFTEHIGEWTPADTASPKFETAVPGGQFCRPVK